MIYCNLKNSDGNSATYDFGLRTDDLSGIVIFYKDRIEPEVVKLPSQGERAILLLSKLNAHHRRDFSKGIFKEKLSYEIG